MPVPIEYKIPANSRKTMPNPHGRARLRDSILGFFFRGQGCNDLLWLCLGAQDGKFGAVAMP
jgi:hypothetical protein